MNLVALAILLPLSGIVLVLLAGGRRTLARSVGVGTSALTVVVAAAILARVQDGSPLVLEVGGWTAPLGIVLVGDRLSGLLLVTITLVALATQAYAIARGGLDDEWPEYHAVHLALVAGMSLALLTGDLFTLFVGFEVALVASYVLLVGPLERQQVREGVSYVAVNVVVSTFLLVAIAGIYATTGTLTLADLAERWPDVAPGVRTALGLLLLIAFATKAAVFPLFGWLPTAYRAAHPAIAAVFAGLLTKLGVYALLRTHSLLDLTGADGGWILPTVAATTMVGGVVGALAQQDFRSVLAFHIVSQIGYMLFGIALFTEAGLAGAIFYLVHHIVVKTSLFLVAGMVEDRAGTGALRELGGLGASSAVLAVLFAIPALSLAGIPPFSGFIAKLALVQAGLDAGAGLLVGISMVVSLLTVLSMTKLWSSAFWGQPTVEAQATVAAQPNALAGPGWVATAGLVATSLVVTVMAAPLLEISTRAAGDLLRPQTLIQEVLAP